MTAGDLELPSILRDWMMLHPHAPEPARVIVASPDVWRRMQAEFRRPPRDTAGFLERQRFDGVPVLIDEAAGPGYFEVMTVEEYARRHPQPTEETPQP